MACLDRLSHPPLYPNMHEVTTYLWSKVEVARRFEGCPGLPINGISDLEDLARREGPLVLDTVLTERDIEYPALLFVVPGLTLCAAHLLAEQTPSEYCEDSADLRTKTAYLSWVKAGVEVRVNAWSLRKFLAGTDKRRLKVFFAAGDAMVEASHNLDATGVEEFEEGVSAIMSCSGVNYNPRFWSDEQWDAAEGAKEIPKPWVHTAQVVYLSNLRDF